MKRIIAKKLTVLFLCMVMALVMLPGMAMADSYELWVGGTRVTDTNAGDVLSDGNVSFAYDAGTTTGTLTINNGVTIEAENILLGDDAVPDPTAAIYAENMKLIINAPNGLKLNNTSGNGYGIYSDQTLQVLGDVELSGNMEYGIYVQNSGGLEVDGNVALNGTLRDGGLYSRYGDIFVTGDVDGFIHSADGSVLKGTDNVNVGGNVTLKGQMKYGLYTSAEAGGIISVTGNVTLSEGDVVQSVLEASETITVNGDVDLNGKMKSGLYVNSGDITVGNVKLATENTSDIIYSRYGDITINGKVEGTTAGDGIDTPNGTLLVTSDVDLICDGSNGIRAAYLSMQSGTWDVTANDRAIRAGEAIQYPTTHGVITPENGEIKEITGPGYSYWTVVEGDGTTVAKHVIIGCKHENVTVISYSVAPNCTTEGHKATIQCNDCGEYIENGETVEALGHTEVVDEAVAATCSATGLTAGSHCSVCGETLQEQEVIEKIAHTYPTNGKCTDELKCTVCGNIKPAGTHSEVIDKAVTATCTKTGLTEGKHCSVCGEVLVAQKDVAALGHTEVIDAVVASTCTTEGKTEGKHCSVCNEVLVKQETVAKTAHSYKDGVCEVCGAKKPSSGGSSSGGGGGTYVGPSTTTATTTTTVKPALTMNMQINNKVITANGKTFTYDVAPFIVGDRTMVPVRVIMETLGAKVDWNDAARTVTITMADKVLTMTIDQEIPGFGTAPFIKNDRTYVPIRYIMENAGAKVEWIAATGEIIITK